jgi:hypothetical protein
MKAAVWVLCGVAMLFGPQGTATFTGVITDDGCAGVGHSRMRMGPTAAECTLACIDAHDSSYVLEDGKDVFRLSDQKTPKGFAGRRVRVTGTLDAATRTIQVDAIAAVE